MRIVVFSLTRALYLACVLVSIGAAAVGLGLAAMFASYHFLLAVS